MSHLMTFAFLVALLVVAITLADILMALTVPRELASAALIVTMLGGVVWWNMRSKR